MALFEQIQSDMKSALKEGRKIELSTLRLLVSDLRNAEKVKKEPLEDQEVIESVQRQIKRRKEAAEQYKAANREDLSGKELQEMEILTKYLPEQLSEDEIRSIVDNAINATGAAGSSDMGKVMGKIMPEVKGKADGAVVSSIVKQQLAKI